MKILVAVDDKAFAQAIVEFLAQHDWEDGTEFKILHVTEGHEIVFPGEAKLYERLAEERQRRGRSLCIDTAFKLQAAMGLRSIKVEELVETGQPKEKILEAAESWPADMIVMGSHGRKGLTRFFLGSVSMAVLSHAPCSVAIVKLPELEKKRQVQFAQTDSKQKKTNSSSEQDKIKVTAKN